LNKVRDSIRGTESNWHSSLESSNWLLHQKIVLHASVSLALLITERHLKEPSGWII